MARIAVKMCTVAWMCLSGGLAFGQEPPADEPGEPVVLVHGFASHPRMWRGTSRILVEQGFVPLAIGWEPARGMGVAGAAKEVLLPAIRSSLEDAGFEPDTPFHAVGHSSGGLLLRWLAQEEGLAAQVVSLTLLSTPNRGARTGVARIACDSFRQPWRTLGCDLIPGSDALTMLGTTAPRDGPRTLAIGVETSPNLMPVPLFDGDGDGIAHSHDNAVMAESPYLEGAEFRIWRGQHQRSHFSVSCSSTVNGWVLGFLRGEPVPPQARGRQPSEDLCVEPE